MGAILEEREQSLALIEAAREWMLANVGNGSHTFDWVIDGAVRSLPCDATTAVAALWDLISSHELELLVGFRVQRRIAA